MAGQYFAQSGERGEADSLGSAVLEDGQVGERDPDPLLDLVLHSHLGDDAHHSQAAVSDGLGLDLGGQLPVGLRESAVAQPVGEFVNATVYAGTEYDLWATAEPVNP